MKTFWFIGFALCFTSIACKPYEIIDNTEFNNQLQYNIAIQNPGEVMEIVYPKASTQGIILDWHQNKRSKLYIVTLIDTINQPYNHAVKYVMKTEYNGLTWSIHSIHKSYSSRYNKNIHWWHKQQ
ncbi:MAG TPA: hypothetical protein PLS12_07150 [Bacteroidales bacterium]|jgi:hypothetical protein|nr:hypothetical protein [Bacteroidales bacterium]